MQRMTDCVEEVDLDEVIPLKDGESQSCCPTTKAISSYGLEDGSNPQPYSDQERTARFVTWRIHAATNAAPGPGDHSHPEEDEDESGVPEGVYPTLPWSTQPELNAANALLTSMPRGELVLLLEGERAFAALPQEDVDGGDDCHRGPFAVFQWCANHIMVSVLFFVVVCCCCRRS